MLSAPGHGRTDSATHGGMSDLDALNKNILLAGEVVANRWRIGEKIGEGTFSQIYSAYSIENNKPVAVKVEAPSSLKPVLEWESVILKSLQDCPYVCRYYYHGKHADSTVLVMELLGESMSMLRVSPDAIHGVPVSKCVAVGIEMLDCIKAFHDHGYVHRDVKASNFAFSELTKRYQIIDFGLSRQHLNEEKKVIQARPNAEFRGTSMYASLSSHRRQELGPKDDLWSWFYLVMDLMRGELPWAADAQQKNRQTVLCLKEFYTEKSPGLLVEGLPGAIHLLGILKYLQSLKYEDVPDYELLRSKLMKVESAPHDDDTLELLNALDSDSERAVQWKMNAMEALQKNAADSVLETLLSMAKKYETFFSCDDLNVDERLEIQSTIYRIEKRLRASAQMSAPPPIQSFVKRRLSEQKIRSDAMRKRRERDSHIRQSLESKLRLLAGKSPSQAPGSDMTPVKAQVDPHDGSKSDSSMEVSDGENMESGRNARNGSGIAHRMPPPPPPPQRQPTQQRPPPPQRPFLQQRPVPPPQRWEGHKPVPSPRPPMPSAPTYTAPSHPSPSYSKASNGNGVPQWRQEAATHRQEPVIHRQEIISHRQETVSHRSSPRTYERKDSNEYRPRSRSPRHERSSSRRSEAERYSAKYETSRASPPPSHHHHRKHSQGRSRSWSSESRSPSRSPSRSRSPARRSSRSKSHRSPRSPRSRSRSTSSVRHRRQHRESKSSRHCRSPRRSRSRSRADSYSHGSGSDRHRSNSRERYESHKSHRRHHYREDESMEREAPRRPSRWGPRK